MVERELKSKAKDATITALIALVFPPAAAGYAAAKMARWVAGELVGEIVDMVTSDGKPPKYDQNFMNGETKKWSGRAVDIKKLTEDTETLTGPWERIDVLNKTLGRIMKVLEVEEVAKEKLAVIHAALESARLANDALVKQWPEVLMRYNKFQAHAERLSALGPVAAEQAQRIYARIDELEDYLYSN